MKSSIDQLNRLRQIEAELDSRKAESDKLRREVADAIRDGRQVRWPPDTPSDGSNTSAPR